MQYIHTMKYYLAIKQEWNTDPCYNVDEPWKDYASERTQSQKTIYMKYQELANL